MRKIFGTKWTVDKRKRYFNREELFRQHFKHLKRITLLTDLVPCPAARVPVVLHDVEEVLDIWHSLQQSAVDSAIDARLCACVWSESEAGHFELWQYANWVSGHWSSEAMFRIVDFFPNRLTIHKDIIQVRHIQVLKRQVCRCIPLHRRFQKWGYIVSPEGSMARTPMAGTSGDRHLPRRRRGGHVHHTFLMT